MRILLLISLLIGSGAQGQSMNSEYVTTVYGGQLLEGKLFAVTIGGLFLEKDLSDELFFNDDQVIAIRECDQRPRTHYIQIYVRVKKNPDKTSNRPPDVPFAEFVVCAEGADYVVLLQRQLLRQSSGW